MERNYPKVIIYLLSGDIFTHAYRLICFKIVENDQRVFWTFDKWFCLRYYRENECRSDNLTAKFVFSEGTSSVLNIQTLTFSQLFRICCQ